MCRPHVVPRLADPIPRRPKDCYTCGFSPLYPGPAGCAALTFDEVVDADIVAFCEASGTNDRGGWPPDDNALDCLRWTPR